jgi:polysaccharide chain length determinant protein (PEP-CTERM system associated)
MSSSRLKKTMEQFGLFRDSLGKESIEGIVENIRQSIEVEQQRASPTPTGDVSYFSISFKGRDPEMVKNIANYLADSFIADMLKSRQKQARETSQFLSKELAKAQTALKEQETKVLTFKAGHLGLLPEQKDINMQMLSQSLQQKERISSEIQDAENRRIILQQQLNQLVTVGMLTNTPQMLGTGIMDPLQQELELARKQYLEKRGRLTDEHPEMIALKKKISRLEGEPGADIKSSDKKEPGAITIKGSLASDIENQLVSVNRKIIDLKEEMKKTDSQVVLYRDRIDRAPQVEQELSALLHDYDNAKESYTTLRKKQLDAGQINMLEAEKQEEYFRVLDPATIPEKPIFPLKSKFLLYSLLVGLGLGIGLMMLMEFLDNSFHTAEDLEKFLGFQVLASITEQHFEVKEERG